MAMVEPSFSNVPFAASLARSMVNKWQLSSAFHAAKFAFKPLGQTLVEFFRQAEVEVRSMLHNNLVAVASRANLLHIANEGHEAFVSLVGSGNGADLRQAALCNFGLSFR